MSLFPTRRCGVTDVKENPLLPPPSSLSVKMSVKVSINMSIRMSIKVPIEVSMTCHAINVPNMSLEWDRWGFPTRARLFVNTIYVITLYVHGVRSCWALCSDSSCFSVYIPNNHFSPLKTPRRRFLCQSNISRTWKRWTPPLGTPHHRLRSDTNFPLKGTS